MTTALYTRILGESKRMVFTYSFLQTTKCASSFGHPILNIFLRCSNVRDDASEVCEFLYLSKWMFINVDIGSYVRRPRLWLVDYFCLLFFE